MKKWCAILEHEILGQVLVTQDKDNDVYVLSIYCRDNEGDFISVDLNSTDKIQSWMGDDFENIVTSHEDEIFGIVEKLIMF